MCVFRLGRCAMSDAVVAVGALGMTVAATALTPAFVRTAQAPVPPPGGSPRVTTLTLPQNSR